MGITANKSNRYFDYDGALQLARQLWQLSETVNGTNGQRVTSAVQAMIDFDGTYARQFADRVGDERASASRVIAGLRADAMECARAWKDAMDEQNRRNYSRHVKELESERNALEKVGDFFTGFDKPSAPNGVPIPLAPAFVPTATPVRYES